MVSSGECSQVIFFDNFQLFVFSFLSFFSSVCFGSTVIWALGLLGPFCTFVSLPFSSCVFLVHFLREFLSLFF